MALSDHTHHSVESRRLRLARATPEKLARARAKRRLFSESCRIDADEQPYLSTQETISATPDDLTRSLEKRRKRVHPPLSSKISSLYSREGGFMTPIGVSTPVRERSVKFQYDDRSPRGSMSLARRDSPRPCSPLSRDVHGRSPGKDVSSHLAVNTEVQYSTARSASCSQAFVPSSIPDHNDSGPNLWEKPGDIDPPGLPERDLHEQSSQDLSEPYLYRSDHDAPYLYEPKSDVPDMLDTPVGRNADSIAANSISTCHGDFSEELLAARTAPSNFNSSVDFDQAEMSTRRATSPSSQDTSLEGIQEATTGYNPIESQERSRLVSLVEELLFRGLLSQKDFIDLLHRSEPLANPDLNNKANNVMCEFWDSVSRADLDVAASIDTLRQLYPFKSHNEETASTVAISNVTKTELVKNIMEKKNLDCDQVRDLLSHSDRTEDRSLIVLKGVPPCRQKVAHRNAFRCVAQKFIEAEGITKVEFLEYVHNRDREVLDVLWSKIKKSAEIGDLLDQQLRDISDEVYPTTEQISEFVVVSNGLKESSAPEHSSTLGRPLEMNSPPPAKTVLAPETSSCLAESDQPRPSSSSAIQDPGRDSSPPEEREGVPGIEFHSPTPAKSPRRTYGTQLRTALSDSQADQHDRTPSRSTSQRGVEPQSALYPDSFVSQRAEESRWHAYHAEHPEFRFRRGPLSRAEVEKVKNAVAVYRNEHDMDEEEFRLTLHDKGSRVKKQMWASLIYCIPQRKPKNMREYIKKAYLPFSERATFTEAEKDTLVGLVREHGHAWAVIGDLMHRYREDCQHVYLKVQEEQLCEAMNRGPWSKAESADFERALGSFQKTDSIDWRCVAEMVGTRTAFQCRDHSRIHTRSDKSYLPGYKKGDKPASVSTVKQKKVNTTKDCGSKIKPKMKRKESNVVMASTDLLLFVEHLRTLDLSSLDVLPDDLSYFSDKFGLVQLQSKITTERKKIRNWRSLDPATTLDQLRSNLESYSRKQRRQRRAPSEEL